MHSYARLRLVDLLAERGELDELRARADARDEYAAERLAGLLAERGELDELRAWALRTGALIGYARVSTSGQLLERQQHALTEADCLRIFADKLSGKDADRPQLAARLDYLRPGDTLVVPSLGRLSRSLAT